MSSKDTEVIMYRSEDGTKKIDVRMEDETVWLSQAQMVELFQSSKTNISEHIKNIFAEGELNEDSVVRNFRTTAADGKNRDCLLQVDNFAERYGKGIQTAIEKATDEYKKYRKRIADLPTPVERDYLETIKQAQKKLKGLGVSGNEF